MTWASSTRGGIGREGAAWLTTNFATKIAKATSDGEKWRIRGERKRFLLKHSAIVARRNFAIFSRNAQPKLGGETPRAPHQRRSRRGGRRGRALTMGYYVPEVRGRLLAAWVARGARLRRGPGAPHARRGVGPTLMKRGEARTIAQSVNYVHLRVLSPVPAAVRRAAPKALSQSYLFIILPALRV